MRLHAQPPARPGQMLAEVDTPALVVDLDAFERNLHRLPGALARKPVRLRPHAKSHKCAEIALRQIAAGAAGICCQKVSEAEALAAGGVKDIHIANEIVGPAKLAALAELARHARVSVCVDDAHNLADLAAAARQAGVRLDVFVEVNAGANRCGAPSPEAALALARAVTTHTACAFAGLQVYHGPAQHVRDAAARRAAAASAATLARTTHQLLAADGITCPIITGGGTGTWEFDAESDVFTELQPGSYIFMDADYARNAPGPGGHFAQSLFVWTTLMSRPDPAWGAVDAGHKAVSIDSGMPLFADHVGVEYARAADEHGVLRFTDPTCSLAVGEKLRLVPGHCDPTVNLHDWLVGYRGTRVETVWPVTARGAIR